MEISYWGVVRFLAHTTKECITYERLIPNEDLNGASSRVFCERRHEDQIHLYVERRHSNGEWLIDESYQNPSLSSIEKVIALYVMKKYEEELRKCKSHDEYSSVEWIDVTPYFSYIELKKSKFFGESHDYFTRIFTKWFRLLHKRYRFHNFSLAKVPASRIYFKNMSEINLHGMPFFHLTIHCNDICRMRNYLEQNSNFDINTKVSDDHPVYPNYTALHFAAASGHFNIFRHLSLNYNAKIDIKESRNLTAVQLVCYKRHENLVKFLVSNHRDFEVCPVIRKDLSYFHLACHYGLIDVVKGFIEAGSVDVNCAIENIKKWRGCTGLHLAIDNEDVAMVKFLLEAGADPNVQCGGGITSLHHACGISDPQFDKVVFFVRERRMDDIDKWISSKKLEEIVDLLLQYKADVNAMDENDESPLLHLYDPNDDKELSHRLKRNKIYNLEKEFTMPKLLNNIINRGRHAIARKLIEHGADCSIKILEQHFLYRIMYSYHSDGTYDIVEYITQLMKDTNIELPDVNNLLYMAVVHSLDGRLIELFLDLGADPNYNYRRPKAGCDANSPETVFLKYMKELPFESSQFARHEITVKFIERGVKLNERLPNGKTPLHVLFSRTERDGWTKNKYRIHNELYRSNPYLFNLDVDINVKDSSGRTPLHYACLRHDADEVIALLENGADFEIADRDGQYPFNCCSKRDCHFLVVSNHINRMQRIGFNVSEQSREFKEMRTSVMTKLRERNEFEKANEEMQKLKKIKINSNISLYNVLFIKSTQKIAALVRTSSLSRWLRNYENLEIFPILRSLLLMQYRRGKSCSEQNSTIFTAFSLKKLPQNRQNINKRRRKINNNT